MLFVNLGLKMTLRSTKLKQTICAHELGSEDIDRICNLTSYTVRLRIIYPCDQTLSYSRSQLHLMLI